VTDSMVDFIEIARTDDLKDDAMKKICTGGRELLLARVGDNSHCADNRCPHLNGDLSRGTLAGKVITCPEHFSQFDLASGAVLLWTNTAGMVARLDRQAHPPRPLSVYEVKVEGDRVLVRLP
jgi:3-phenylpropionate/trans-cinnamate dioxygenase ferredoxin component